MTSPVIWTRLGLVSPLYARMNGMPATPVSGISIDTRTLQPGDLFFAIRGDHSDGHDHVATAFEKGAAAAVVDEAKGCGDGPKNIAASKPLFVASPPLAGRRERLLLMLLL